MNLTKIIFLCLISSTFLFWGYSDKSEREAAKELTNFSDTLLTKSDQPALFSVQKNQQEELISQAKLAISELPIPENKKYLYEILSNDSVGSVILDAIRANSLEDKIQGAEQVREEAYQKARNNSKQSIKKITETIDSLQINGDSVDKMRLLDIAGHLDGVDEEVFNLSKEVLANNIVPARANPDEAQTEEELNAALSTTFEMAVPVMAHLIAISKADNPNEALEMSLDAIQDQPEIFITNQIIDNTIKKYPDFEEVLLQARLEKESNQEIESITNEESKGAIL